MDLKEAKALAFRFAIESALGQHFFFGEGRERRGVVQGVIAKHLGVVESAHLHRQVKKILEELGVRATQSEGKPYYSNLKFKD